MPMPVDLVLVRHGQSEGNVAVHASKRGDDSHMENPDFRGRHSSWWRLTDLGVEQARLAGQWIRENFPPVEEDDPADASSQSYDVLQDQAGGEAPLFHRHYSSAYIRAMETSANLGLPRARWYLDPNLRERERGKEDLLSSRERELLVESARERDNAPLYWKPLNGESIADTATRVRDLCETLHREVPDGRVIVVCHGEVMEAFRLVLERMTPHDYAEWTTSTDPKQRINNGQVFHYSRRDPHTGEILPYLNWRRSISTSDLSLCDPEWKSVTRPVFDNDALMKLVERTPRIIR